MISALLEQQGINPKLIQDFLHEHVQMAEQINDDIVNAVDPVGCQKNKVMLTQVKLLILLLDE